jgi:hypothetical protein
MQVEMEVAWLVKEGKALMGFPTGGQALRPVAALGLLASLNLALLDKVDRPSVACAVVEVVVSLVVAQVEVAVVAHHSSLGCAREAPKQAFNKAMANCSSSGALARCCLTFACASRNGRAEHALTLQASARTPTTLRVALASQLGPRALLRCSAFKAKANCANAKRSM